MKLPRQSLTIEDRRNKRLLCMACYLCRFVTTDSGTGSVHIAPAFGDVDYEVLVNELNASKNHTVRFAQHCRFQRQVHRRRPEYCRGRWVKDCDKDIIRDLKDRGLLFHREEYCTIIRSAGGRERSR